MGSIFYDKHFIFCDKEQIDNKKCCGKFLTPELFLYIKEKINSLKANNVKVKVNKTKCLGNCAYGPVLIIYPQCTWYRYSTKSDIDNILEYEIIHNKRFLPLCIT